MTDALFVLALVLIWGAILTNLVLALAGADLARRAERPPRARRRGPLPGVSLIVPARDEEDVIEKSIRTFLALDYPRHRLQVVVVDDGSTDETSAICDCAAAADDRVTVVHVPVADSGRGKAAALNRALPHCRHGLLAVYDADTRPRRDALRGLVAALDGDEVAAAVGGLVKVPRGRSLLNRLCRLEWIVFQWTFQAGRSRLFGVTFLTGTNYMIRAAAVRDLGGWDPRALTEDLELSVRLYRDGRRIGFAPLAVAEEHDPVRLRVWLRQRTRWLLGNYYVLFRHAGSLARTGERRALVVLWEMTSLYATFLVGLVLSQALFFGGVVGALESSAEGPVLALWALAFVSFLLTVQIAAAIEGSDSWRTPLLGTVMYFVYCPLWLLVFLRSAFVYVASSGEVRWAKTPHTAS
jgi:cellulose synthase/poly-beta-1,6-N-acetylglucosamine synthase-like glycosyltransferase